MHNRYDPAGQSFLAAWNDVFRVIDYGTIIIFFAIFPFYVYVHKINDVKDREALVFPITNHFYKTVVLMIIGYVIVVLLVLFLATNSILSYIGFLSLPAWALVIVTYHLIVEVFHVLISLLAIEKFLIYFFPSWEKNVLIVQKFVQKYILLLYLGCCLKYALLYALESWFGGGRGWELSYGISYYSLYILLFISVLLYIPVIISVRKLSHLQSAQLNNPQRYIMIQIIVVFIVKIVNIIPRSFVAFLYKDPLYQILIVPSLSDIVAVPLIVQVSYLGSNKRNWNLLFKKFSFMKFGKVLLFGYSDTEVVRPLQLESTMFPPRF
ncbi:Serpentine Receptor, class Z [Caenorhabditis elegans]|uniref:Serpentine Receptor, class Z n=1 Tax=Caenorhabditis elegans TaxID=6239 RepID=Q65CL7_CAEEL|nr:Serpentine Receptor, class Z [Caenorhabditis elegans]CCD70724.2 Serpentine Receptor, class Z [Caenorhabditis elegans]|eukprot:NP_001343665.1 Serpentine Receptor, class Z [Caenorhabditis elegans]